MKNRKKVHTAYITVHNNQTGKTAKINVNKSYDVLENKRKSLALMRLFELILETELDPIWDAEAGFRVNLNKNQISTIIEVLEVFFEVPFIFDEIDCEFFSRADAGLEALENMRTAL